jgi:hypothetical protein
VYAEYLEAAVLVGYADVDLAIESSESTQCRVHGIRTIRGPDDDDGRPLLEPVHEGEHLTHDAPIYFLFSSPLVNGTGSIVKDKDHTHFFLRTTQESTPE